MSRMYLYPKYIMINGLYPIIFAPSIQHDKFKYLGEITSAGFVKITDEDVICYGESLSLNLKPSFDDAEFIKLYLGLKVTS